MNYTILLEVIRCLNTTKEVVFSEKSGLQFWDVSKRFTLCRDPRGNYSLLEYRSGFLIIESSDAEALFGSIIAKFRSKIYIKEEPLPLFKEPTYNNYITQREAIKAACINCIQNGDGCGHIDRDSESMFTCDSLSVLRGIFLKNNSNP